MSNEPTRKPSTEPHSIKRAPADASAKKTTKRPSGWIDPKNPPDWAKQYLASLKEGVKRGIDTP